MNRRRTTRVIAAAVGAVVVLDIVWDQQSFNFSRSSQRRRWLIEHDGENPDELKRLYLDDGHHQISRDYRLVYCHCPKTGGSTIERSSLFDEKQQLTGLGSSSHRNIRHMMPVHPEQVRERHLEDFITATHIRHPCDRFMSAYYYITQDKRSRGCHKQATELGLMNHSSIEEFLDWVDATPGQWTKLKRKIFHFHPMVTWLVHQDDSFGIDEVLCQEHWQEGLKRLFKRLNQTIPTDVNHRKLSNHHQACEQLDPHYREIIMREYEVDNCLFGYGPSKYAFPDSPFAIDDIDDTKCIGAQKDRLWFTERWSFCKSYVDQRFIDELVYGADGRKARTRLTHTAHA